MAWWNRWTRWSGAAKAISKEDLFLDLLNSAASKTGLRVTWETALQASTALACARVIAEGIAQVPLKLHRKAPGSRDVEDATDHPLYPVLHDAPNAWCTSFEWRETLGLHLAMAGRSYAYINRARSARGESIELLPIAPNDCRTELGPDRRPRYFVRFGDGRAEEEVPAERILHLHGPSWNGWEGLDGIRLAREAIGLALATEEHGARFFGNGAITGGVLTTDQVLNKDQIAGLRASWTDAQAGLRNAYKTAVLWGGLKWQPRGMQNDQAQWVEVRRFQVAEVCRVFRVLPIMVGDADKTATYASAEQMFLAHVVHTMGPHYTRIEQRLNLQLLTADERRAGYFTRFNVAGLLRGSHRDRAEFYRVMHGLGAMSANEIRALEERNPYPAGDRFLQPLNMIEAGTQPGAAPEDPPQ
jgi:HK97 family phage portal protein